MLAGCRSGASAAKADPRNGRDRRASSHRNWLASSIAYRGAGAFSRAFQATVFSSRCIRHICCDKLLRRQRLRQSRCFNMICAVHWRKNSPVFLDTGPKGALRRGPDVKVTCGVDEMRRHAAQMSVDTPDDVLTAVYLKTLFPNILTSLRRRPRF